MAGVYRPRHPERTVLYRVLFHHFERFLAEYEVRFERECGFFRPIVKDVVERYLDCGNPRCGFARIRCPDCAEERLVMFSCRTRGFCPSCHAKRLEEWGEWMRETILLDVPHRQVVFTIPKRLRLFFKYDRRLLGDLCRAALRSLERYFEAVTGGLMTPGVVAARRLPSKGWAALIWKPHLGLRSAAMIRKVYEVDPMRCPQCGGAMRVVAFLTEPAVVDRIIDHLKLTFVAEKPPPEVVHQALLCQERLWEADPPAGYFPDAPAEHVT